MGLKVKEKQTTLIGTERNINHATRHTESIEKGTELFIYL